MLFRNQTRWWCTALLCVSSLHLSGCHPSTLHHLNLLMQSHSCVHSPEGHRAHHEPTSYVRGPIQSGRAEFWWWPHGKSWPGFGVWRRGDARPRRRDGDGAGSSLCWGIAASSRLERLEGGWRCCQVTWGYQQPKHIPISAVKHKINIWFIRGGGETWSLTNNNIISSGLYWSCPGGLLLAEETWKLLLWLSQTREADLDALSCK